MAEGFIWYELVTNDMDVDAGGKVVLPPMDVPGGSRILQATDDQDCHFAPMQGPKS